MVSAVMKDHPRTWINWDGETDQWADLLGEDRQNFRAEHVRSVDELPQDRRDRLTGGSVASRSGPGLRPGMSSHVANKMRSGRITEGSL
jgi:hypothetical protein